MQARITVHRQAAQCTGKQHSALARSTVHKHVAYCIEHSAEKSCVGSQCIVCQVTAVSCVRSQLCLVSGHSCVVCQVTAVSCVRSQLCRVSGHSCVVCQVTAVSCVRSQLYRVSGHSCVVCQVRVVSCVRSQLCRVSGNNCLVCQVTAVSCVRSQRREPAGGGVRFGTATARHHASKDHRTGALRRPTLRHIADTAGLQRLRIQDTGQVRSQGYASIIIAIYPCRF